MSKELKKRTIVYSNVKENKKKAEKLKELQDAQINLNDEFIIGLDGVSKEKKSFEKNEKKSKNANKGKSINKNKIDNKNKLGNKNKIENKNKQVNKNKIDNRNKSVNENKFDNRNKSVNENNFDNRNRLVNENKLGNMQKSVNRNKLVNNKQKENKNIQYSNAPSSQKNTKIKKKIIFYFITSIIISALIIGLLSFLKAPLFNIKDIKVTISNNAVLTELRIEELMGLEENQNIFSFKKKNLINQIKSDSYVENVKIKRNLPNNLIVEVEERSVKFQLEKEGKFIYVDKQGYILEHTENKNDCMVITGFSTEDLSLGNRLNSNDLDGLSAVIQIMQEANNNEILNLISSINIDSKNDYIINFDSIGKLAHLGNMKSINDKMTYIKKIIDVEKDYEGEIYVNVDLNKGEYPFFREKV